MTAIAEEFPPTKLKSRSAECYISPMERFLIEVPHEAREEACLRAVRILIESGSHFLTNSDFGCMDDVHKAWIIVEVDSKEEARSLLPPLYRSKAQIVKLTKFSLAEVDRLLERHSEGGQATQSG
jgi:hypothetical protein